MNTKDIYLIRHGQTDFNLRGIIQGSRVDTDLNDTGMEQSRLFYEHYKHLPFARIYTSTLKRSIQSVSRFIEQGIPFEKHAGLNEISWGDKDGVENTGANSDYYHEVLERWASGETDMNIGGGDSPLQVMERQKPVLARILSNKDETPVLVCMHGRAMRILLCMVTGKELKYMDQFHHQNLCLYILRYFYEDDHFEILENNNTAHLGMPIS